MRATAALAHRAVVVNPFLGPSRALPRSAMRASSSLLMRHSASLPPSNSSATALLIPKPMKKEDAGAKGAKTKSPEASSNPSGSADPEARKAGTPEFKISPPAGTQAENGVEKKDGSKKEDKPSLMQRIKHEILHYWDGTKLLATEVKISSRLALKMAAGYELTRRENRQLQRTVKDLARLVPFSVFIIVPFAELLLPVALRLFPNLLPSTYEGQKSKDKKAQALRSTRKEVSDLLRQTLKETGLPLTSANAKREEFTNFFRKVRATGEKPTAEDVIDVCKIFKDDLTLDNLSRPQLVSMCRYLGMNTYGTDGMLRYQIRVRMRQIKEDDRAIAYEGVGSLTVAELQVACQNRGIPSYGVSPAKLREDVQTWLDLRLQEGVPSTLLVLSNAYMYGQAKKDDGMSSQIDALVGVLSSIPEELFHEIELEVHTSEGAATNKQRLEVLKEQEELIDEENEQNEETSKSGVAMPADTEDIDEKDEATRRADAESAGLEKDRVTEALDAEEDAAAAAAARAVAPMKQGNVESADQQNSTANRGE
ncbi:hypothetical protein P8C59_008113 [Phyllachora maydis]|uniref:Letm1 RBD domain-containing protein n=1 Tax=Phyllachora maydis TaxID=1825666 RepID=A0AAD9I9Z1_9PEZI|nr:hypothetical protein P8C59_008113 [Phyllachora maydis]